MAASDIPSNATSATPRAWTGPRGNWLLGCLRPMQNDAFHFYQKTWQAYGDYARIRAFPGMYVYLLADPSAIEHVLYKNHKNYRKPDLINKPVSLLTGNGIFTSEGDFWLRQRRLSQPAFLRHHLAAVSSHITASTDLLIGEWERREPGRVFDIVPEMMRLALRIASRALFSHDISGEADSIGHAYRVAFDYVSARMNGKPRLPLWVPTRGNRAFKHSKALLDRVVLEVIESRRHNKTVANDVLDRLLAAQDDEGGAGMTDQQLRDEVLTLLTAGHETIGAGLSWAWYLLGQHPEVQQSLHDEAAGHLRGRIPTADDLPHLPLALAVFEETLRLYPPAWGMPRESIEPDEINGYPLPAKAILTVSQWLAHHHPAHWEEPERFKPERFLPSGGHDRPRMAYFPFGGGPRICIGNHFALMEGPLVLAALAQRFHFTLTPGQTVSADATFTLRPKTGVQVTARKR